MWPMLLNLTPDECRRTLRRLELEAYSNMISVLRAQGALEDSRKKLLEELRAVLHISQDRHSVEARRVSNDELLATIAEHLAGPNTGLGWISEGRRRIPLLPRGVPQTMYTEIADRAAEAARAENKEIQKRLDAKLVAPKTNEEGATNAEGETAESLLPNEMKEELICPPVAMEDQTIKLWETELMIPRKRKPEGGVAPDEYSTPVKNMRNIPANTNQKHLNLAQIYSKFSQQPMNKASGQSKHSYNQVSKVSTSKSTHSQTPRSTPHKQTHRPNKQTRKSSHTPRQRKSHEPTSPSKHYAQNLQLEYGNPNSFQASYAQSVLGKNDYDDIKPKGMSSASMMTDSPTMQLLTQPATVPHELGVSDSAHPDDPASLQAQCMSTPKTISGKPCHLVIKKRGEVENKMHMSDIKVLKKQSDGLKLISNRQVVVAPSSTQKALNTNKLVPTKVIGSIPKPRTSINPAMSDKMLVVPKHIPETKMIVTSGASTPSKDHKPQSANNISPKATEQITPKGIPATDLKVSAKTFVLNSKSGQKMVVVPAHARSKPGKEGQIPLLHFKGISTAMKLVPVSSQSGTPVGRTPAVAVISKPVNTLPPNTKILGVEPIKTANLADIVPAKGVTPVTTPKISHPIVRPGNTKSNVIVVQKGATLGKTLSFTKNGNDMSKIIMGKNVNQLLQASKPEQKDAKCAGNVIVLELNNEQSGRTTTLSEILDNRGSVAATAAVDEAKVQITQDTPVLFDNQIVEETCNASSMDSAVDSIEDIEDSSIIQKADEKSSDFNKDPEAAKDSSSVTDWELELDTVSRKGKDDDDKLNSLHLDLGMSSDSENEFMDTHKTKSKHSSQESLQRDTPTGESSMMYGSSAISHATRTLLSQLQDDGSSSNDSSFALKSKTTGKLKDGDSKIDKCESDALTKAKEKLSKKVAEERSRQKRIDIYSTAIIPSDIHLDSFSYLDEGMMAGDDVFATEEAKDKTRRSDVLDDQLSRLLGEDSAHSTDSQTVSESLPIKQ